MRVREVDGRGALVLELDGAPGPSEALELFADLPHCALLESQGDHGALGRFSFLSADPFLRLEAKGRSLTWSVGAGTGTEPGRRSSGGTRSEAAPRPSRGSPSEAVRRPSEGDPFAAVEGELHRLRRRLGDSGVPAPGPDGAPDALPPFRGGLLGYFGYDLLHHLERVPPPAFDDLALPDLDVGFHDWTLAWDHASGRTWVFSTGLHAALGSHRMRAARDRADVVLGRLRGPVPPRAAALLAAAGSAASGSDPAGGPPDSAPAFALAGPPGLRSTFSAAGYRAAVERAREYILAGDVFEVNLSQRLSLPFAGSGLELHHRLRAANPAPFAAYLGGRRATVLSASPERFVRVSGDLVETRPIKGTTARGYTPEHDFALGDDLQLSEKDRAENVMIVDLLRNDLSRVALDRSVRVPNLWDLERHPTVHHLVSTVTARLRPGLGPVDVLRAAFPGGSVTGAPKVRAMEIIHELEPVRRGVYCGSIGYVGFDGAADLSIAIRTVTLAGGTAHLSVGGAVVADSDPGTEYRETLLKAAGLLRAFAPAPVLEAAAR
jgi:para-aminobenzoate synthetase component 1